MRFSAATANPHRIHYDWPYATRVEGYPGLVVHGPLMTLALAEILRLEGHQGRIVRLRHRNRKPLFCGQSAQLRRVEDATPLTLGVFSTDSEPCSTLTIEQEGAGHA
jgi:3-methylfumaryl-CoA hydratase